MTKCFSIQVVGKVQGVWFRASTKKQADLLMINGFVKNETDGSVYIEAIGQETDMDLFVEWCKEGPELAEVKELIIKSIADIDNDNFSILR